MELTLESHAPCQVRRGQGVSRGNCALAEKGDVRTGAGLVESLDGVPGRESRVSVHQLAYLHGRRMS